MNADGTGQTQITTYCPCRYDYGPNWSPDGTKLVASLQGVVTIMNPDGTGAVAVTEGSYPAWSPDGTKIVFSRSGPPSPEFDLLFTINPDGTGETQVRGGGSPDWQPVPVAPYEHPLSASQLSVALVPAFSQCGTGGNPSNSKHGPTLSVDSCNPPRPGSVLAVVGTTSQSSAQMTVVPGDSDPTNGNQANVSLTAALSDIQSASGGDYNPNPSGADLTAVTRLRFTDKANGYGGLPATATEYDFRVPIDCSSTPDPTIGSTCSANTTANALVPGLIQEQRQTVAQTFRVRVDDSGANGIRGDSDDRIFATQGVFVP